MRVGVVDYGVGNLGSMLRTLEELRVTPVLIERATELHTADCLILPGVGNFADCARLLQEGGWVSALHDEVLGKQRRLLGVCVGMQLLADASTEGMVDGGETPGLGFVPGRVVHLRSLGCALRVPHVGWNEIRRGAKDVPLLAGLPERTDFYFVHSYAFVPADPLHGVASTDYGVPVTAVVRRDHIWGTQFHPEKSSRAGYRVLRNFISGQEC
uniref:Imidazole glycerol phosphate synthase subunit HisH n=1 Tax=Curvibacter symbiont subsp. Hydra magnipapillata TaxID=667019 RepID=C9YDK9_CURXX|nr:Imidazole glycerol phosphate synthase subunit hisH [Curvibacter putative symbiont of Hydra magnipapillata]